MSATRKAGCGHEVDLWCANPRTVCKACFEKQGFTYNRNSFADIDKNTGSARAGMGTPLRGDDTPDKRAAMKREIAAILNPIVCGPRSYNNPERVKERAEALALIKERFNIGRATALQYAKEFRTAA